MENTLTAPRPTNRTPHEGVVDASTLREPMSDLPFGGAAVGRGLHLAGLALLDLLMLMWLSVVVVLSCFGVGLPLVNPTLAMVRGNAERHRRLSQELTGVPVAGRYLPVPSDEGRWGLRAARRQISDPTVWRDLLWNVTNPAVGLLLGILPAAMLLHGVWGVSLLAMHHLGINQMAGASYGLIHLGDTFSHYLAAGTGMVWIVLGIATARPLLRISGLWTHLSLNSSSTAELRQRVSRLTQTRATALDIQEAEIQRIERDLHDGAQARLVAMGMTISRASRLLETDPAAAAELLDSAKQDSATALQELRNLVRGIRPPVLADRGLAEALRALAAASPVQTEVSTDLDHRLAGPLETALYFAASELVTNAAKHSGASVVDVDLRAEAGTVWLIVADNGVGGAEAAAGGGLDGIRRRLEPFDGDLALSSPVGGPTIATMTVADRRA